VKTKEYAKKGTQILLAGNLGFIEESELGTPGKPITELERKSTALMKSIRNKLLNP
jgi:hypothetical protein